MHKEVCINCKRTMKVDYVGAYAIEFMDKELTQPYKLWSCDLVKCPECGFVLATRWGQKPQKEHFEPDFQEFVTKLREGGKPVYEFY